MLNEGMVGGFGSWRIFIVSFCPLHFGPIAIVFCSEPWSALATPTPPRLLRRPWFGRGRRFLYAYYVYVMYTEGFSSLVIGIFARLEPVGHMKRFVDLS